jgi:hypothetical protein
VYIHTHTHARTLTRTSCTHNNTHTHKYKHTQPHTCNAEKLRARYQNHTLATHSKDSEADIHAGINKELTATSHPYKSAPELPDSEGINPLTPTSTSQPHKSAPQLHDSASEKAILSGDVAGNNMDIHTEVDNQITPTSQPHKAAPQLHDLASEKAILSGDVSENTKFSTVMINGEDIEICGKLKSIK